MRSRTFSNSQELLGEKAKVSAVSCPLSSTVWNGSATLRYCHCHPNSSPVLPLLSLLSLCACREGELTCLSQQNINPAMSKGRKCHRKKLFSIRSSSWITSSQSCAISSWDTEGKAAAVKEQDSALGQQLAGFKKHDFNSTVTLLLHILLCPPAIPNEVVTSGPSADGHHLLRKALKHLPHRFHNVSITYANFSTYDSVKITIWNILYNSTQVHTNRLTHICVHVHILLWAQHDIMRSAREKLNVFPQKKSTQENKCTHSKEMVFQERKSPGKNTKLAFAKCPDYTSSFLKKGLLF